QFFFVHLDDGIRAFHVIGVQTCALPIWPATRLAVDERYVELADGGRIAYDDVVVAPGARARPSPWGEPPGVHVLRTLDDAIALEFRRASWRAGVNKNAYS